MALVSADGVAVREIPCQDVSDSYDVLEDPCSREMPSYRD